MPSGKGRGVAPDERRPLLVIRVQLVEEPEARGAEAPPATHAEAGVEDRALDLVRDPRVVALPHRQDPGRVHEAQLAPTWAAEHARAVRSAELRRRCARSGGRRRGRHAHGVRPAVPPRVGNRLLGPLERLLGQLLGLVQEAHTGRVGPFQDGFSPVTTFVSVGMRSSTATSTNPASSSITLTSAPVKEMAPRVVGR